MAFYNRIKLKPNRALFQTLLFLIVVFFISTLSLFLGFFLKYLNPSEYGLIKSVGLDLEITYKEILFFASLGMAFLLLSVSFQYIKNKKWKVFLICFASIYLIASALMILADVIYYLIFAYRLTFAVIQTVLNTNAEEIKDFIKVYSSIGSLVAIFIFILTFFLIVLNRRRFIILFSTFPFFIVSMLLTSIGIIDFIQMAYQEGNGPHNVRYWDILVGEYNQYREFNRKLKEEKNDHTLSAEYNSFYKKDTIKKTLVFVISESLSKRHMSLYGYKRQTTPNLDTNKTIFKFTNCVTSSALTLEAVPRLFFNGYFSKRINLIALLNKSGYETSWISNQSGWGKGDATIVILSKLCKQTVFLDAMADDHKANSSLHYDEELIKQFDKVLNAPCNASKFIVLHFMGCHFDYEKRYPAERIYFSDQAPSKIAVNTKQAYNAINAYDNAVVYHDSVVNEVLKLFTKYSLNKNAALIFLSDHGEELYENRNYAGHGYPPKAETAEIPYFTMLSDCFMRQYPDLAITMKQRKNTAYSSSNNFYTLLHLLNINSASYENKIQTNAFFSAGYDSTSTRFIMGEDYKKMIHQ